MRREGEPILVLGKDGELEEAAADVAAAKLLGARAPHALQTAP